MLGQTMRAAGLGLAILAALYALAAFETGPVRAASCDAVRMEFADARKTGEIDKIAATYARLSEKTTACNEHVLHCAGDSVARSFVEASYSAADRGADAREVRDLLETGRKFGSPWQLLVGLGDTSFADARERKDGAAYQRAATEYQDALNVISQESTCGDFDEPAPPSPVEIEPIHKRMTEALLLAPRFEMIRTREGNCGGVFLASVRGFTPTFRPIPINFVFAQSTFTPEGDKAAAVLLACLKDEKYRRVVLSGHTDKVGSAGYNMDLSKRRLDAVAGYLRKGGFTGELVLQPKGKSEPFEPDDPTAYSEEEVNQLNRRVVLRESIK